VFGAPVGPPRGAPGADGRAPRRTRCGGRPASGTPQPCTGLQCRRRGGPARHGATWGGPSGENRWEAVTAMHRGPLPAAPQPAGPLAPQGRQAGPAIEGMDRLRLTGKRALPCQGEGADRRALLPGPPCPEAGGRASGGRWAEDTGQGRAAGFIAEAARLPGGGGPFLRAGQVAVRQRVRAAASRGQARRAARPWVGVRFMPGSVAHIPSVEFLMSRSVMGSSIKAP
jgi:hypothetical protein